MKTTFYAIKHIETGEFWVSFRGKILFNSPNHAAASFNYSPRWTKSPKLKESKEYKLVTVKITEVSE